MGASPGLRVNRTVPSMARVTTAFLVLAVAGCRPESEAVIALHGVPADRIYLESLADSLASGTPPIRVHIFNPPMSPNATYEEALVVGEETVALQGLVGVVGHRDSRSTLVVGPLYRDAGIPLVVPNATSRAIAELGPMVFRLVPDDVEEGAFLARAAAEALGARSITVFHVGDEYGAGIRDGVLAAAAGEGLRVLDVVEYGLSRLECPGDFQPFVDASLLRGAPDVVVLGSRTPDAACVARLFLRSLPEVRFVAGDGVDQGPGLLDRIGEAAPALWVAKFFAPGDRPELDSFHARYRAVTGVSPDPGTALRWDGVLLLVEAIRSVGADRERVAAWLAELGRKRPPFRGVTGDIAFTGGFRHTLVMTDAAGRRVPWEPR
ncbi:MAG: ABC transporter substrate-binding protein [Gemmatimonadetes bacterium]|nr:ABC transporter substrate-binding protein [Gemmatimonadota bacterium]